MEESRSTTRLRKSCTLCSHHHVACEGKQPCQRCVEWGKATQCEFLLSRKRGPQKRAKPSSGDRVTTARKKLRPTTTSDAAPPAPWQVLDEGGVQGAKQAILPAKSSAVPMTTLQRSCPADLSRAVAVARAQSSEMAAGQPASVAVPATILSLLIEQVRDLRKDNQLLVERVMSLQNQQTVFERQIDSVRDDHKSSTRWLMDQLAALDASRTLQVRMQDDLLSQPIAPGSDMHLSAIKHILPFLAAYDLSETGLVVDDLRKPFAASSVRKDKRGIQMTYIYVSPAYVELVGYDASELLGAPVALVCDPHDNETRETVFSYLNFDPRLRVGPIFATRSTAIRRDGRVVRTSSRHQFFFDSAGNSKWCVTAIDGVLPRGEESPLYIDAGEIQQQEADSDTGREGGNSDHDDDSSTSYDNTSGGGNGHLDRDLDELLHTLSPSSPCPL